MHGTCSNLDLLFLTRFSCMVISNDNFIENKIQFLFCQFYTVYDGIP